MGLSGSDGSVMTNDRCAAWIAAIKLTSARSSTDGARLVAAACTVFFSLAHEARTRSFISGPMRCLTMPCSVRDVCVEGSGGREYGG
jgi:hypothetical protein